jgi:hypothetical protein
MVACVERGLDLGLTLCSPLLCSGLLWSAALCSRRSSPDDESFQVVSQLEQLIATVPVDITMFERALRLVEKKGDAARSGGTPQTARTERIDGRAIPSVSCSP